PCREIRHPPGPSGLYPPEANALSVRFASPAGCGSAGLTAGPRSRKTACSPDPQEPLSPRPDAIRVHADQLPDILRTSDVSKTSLRQGIAIDAQPAGSRNRFLKISCRT